MTDTTFLETLYKDSCVKAVLTDGSLNILWRSCGDLPESFAPSDFYLSPGEPPSLPIKAELICRHINGSAVIIRPFGDDGELLLEFHDPVEIGKLTCHSAMLDVQDNFLGNIRFEIGDAITCAKRLLDPDSSKDTDPTDLYYSMMRCFATTVNYEESAIYFCDSVLLASTNISKPFNVLCAYIKELFAKENCKFEYTVDDDICAVTSYRRLEFAVLNILTNAIQYCNADEKEIDLEIKNFDDEFSITITDNGNNADLDYIRKCTAFGRTAQKADGEHNLRRDRNELLGLYSVKAMTDRFSGTLEFRSSPTGGLTVYILLPKLPKNTPLECCVRAANHDFHIDLYDRPNCLLSKGVGAEIIESDDIRPKL